MIAADVDTREVAGGGRLLVEDDWLLSPHHAFPHGSPSPAETGMSRRMSWWGGSGVVNWFREKKGWRREMGRWPVRGGRRAV
jgi:hypothetical protein